MAYTKTCTGPNKQNRRSEIGKGSHTASSHTSRFLSGWALLSAVSGVIRLARSRSGEEVAGEPCTGTLRADGVPGCTSMLAANILYLRVRVKVYTPLVIANAPRPQMIELTYWGKNQH